MGRCERKEREEEKKLWKIEEEETRNGGERSWRIVSEALTERLCPTCGKDRGGGGVYAV